VLFFWLFGGLISEHMPYSHRSLLSDDERHRFKCELAVNSNNYYRPETVISIQNNQPELQNQNFNQLTSRCLLKKAESVN